MHDAHVHLGFALNPAEVALQAQQQGSLLFCQTVEPEEYQRLRLTLGSCSNVCVGLGLHPWWVTDDQRGRERLERALDLLPDARFVGEVGLDFASRHRETADAQVAVFTQILEACGRQGNKALSLHCVQAYGPLLDVLERTKVASSCAVVLHWFSGTSDDLTRARRLGCYFSVSERMLSSKRGRAYVKALPLDRILLETDAPTGDPAEMPQPLTYAQIASSLHRVQALVDRERDASLGAQIDKNTRRMLGLFR